MATADMHAGEPLTKEKLAGIEVSVAEIEDESPSVAHALDSLTIHSPVPSLRPVPVIDCPPPHHHHPRPSSPTGSVRSSFSSRRRVTRHSHSHWSSGFSMSHRSEISKELSRQAESEFLALMELMSGISRRSSSLKECWTKIISERESWAMEMDQMHERFEEYTETIERKSREHKSHEHEHDERKKELTKLRLELTASMSSTAEFKQKLLERDRELGDARREIAEFKDNFKYLKEEHEETKTTLEETQLKLVASEEACRHAKEDAKKHRDELRTLKQTYTELQTSHTELTTKFESTHKELFNLKQSHSVLKKEKHEWLHEKGELEEDNRKCRHREDELKHRLKEVTESYEKKKHEVHELKETISKIKYEKEELTIKVKELKRKLEEEHCRYEDAEDRCGKWKLKWEHSEREITSIREELRIVEIERTELHETIKKKTEEIKRITIEKERIEEEHHDKCKEAEDCHREIIVLKESLRRVETTLKEKTELIHTLHERIERTECDRDVARTKCGDLSVELSSLQASTISLKLEIETITSERESLREKLHECETRYEEVCESVTEYHEGNSSFEYEISNLRTMLREVREQKEKAITMRNAADRERDESIAKYEEKCRDLDRLEESFSAHMHSCGKSNGGGRTIIRRNVRESSGTFVDSVD